MSRNSGRSTPPAGDSPLDPRLCAELGATLTRVRTSRTLTVDDVAGMLLLSTRQVRALEQVDFTAFHNASFFVIGLRKYAAFAGVNAAQVDLIARPVAKPEPTPGSDDEPSSSSSSVSSSRGPLQAVIVLVILAAVVLAYLFWPRSVATPRTANPRVTARVAPSSAPPPAAQAAPPIEVPVAATAPEASAVTAATVPPEATPEEPAPPAAFGSVRVRKGTWVFVRSSDNAVIERVLSDGESMALGSQPTYLAVGSPDVVLTIGGQLMATARFVVNGQLRMRGADFDELVHGSVARPASPASRR